jgi:HEAT repeat protein
MADPDSVVLKQILSELRDVNKERRRTAVMKLGMMGGEDAVTNLIMLVRNHNEDLIVRGRAALMLGKLGDARAVEPLIEALDAPGFQTPLYALESLGRLGDQRAVEPLQRMLTNHHDKFREAARVALGRLGIPVEVMSAPENEARPQPTAPSAARESSKRGEAQTEATPSNQVLRIDGTADGVADTLSGR